jgi:GAF domain-containing protein
MEQRMEQGNPSRTSQANVSAALAASDAAIRGGAIAVRFPGEDGGQSLAEMAQRDLDAALQLLTDRAQYITGSTGAAIALRRNGKNDMMCCATTGSNAPELGVLLSTEYGLSGESVRTRRALRCDDAERDTRVNHEVCRELGIASVVVMPVVHDDEVLGVFELFSGKPMAFGERDVSALARLSEMVETAVTLARAAVASDQIENATPSVAGDAAESTSGPRTLNAQVSGAPILIPDLVEESIEDPVIEVEQESAVPASAAAPSAEKNENKNETESPVAFGTRAWPTDVPELKAEAAAASSGVGIKVDANSDTVVSPAAPAAALRSAVLRADLQPATSHPATSQRATSDLSSSSDVTSPASSYAESSNATSSDTASVASTKKPLLWSSALNAAEDQKATESDRSHVPPVFRNLSQCQACGFPISTGRTLCVECEEKKWRGQLKMPATPVAAAASGESSGAAAAPAPALVNAKPNLRKPLPPAKLVTATTSPKSTSAPQPVSAQIAEIVAPTMQTTPTSQRPVPMPVFTGSLEPSQSWIARNKYMVGTLLLVAAAVAAVVFLR